MKRINREWLAFKIILLGFNLSAQITSTDGLENLKSIEGDLIISETQITNLDGFIALENVSGDVIIKNNSSLANYCGLKNLFENGVIGGGITIEGNQLDLDTSNLDFSSCETLGSSEELKERILFYPNPVIDYIHISNTENLKSISIYNVLGGLVLFKETNLESIDLSGVTSGYYTLKIKDALNKTINIKLMKQ